MKKSVLREFAVAGCLAVVSAVLPATIRAEKPVDDFSWYDAFTQKTSTADKVTFHGYAYFDYVDAQHSNTTFDQHVFEPFFGYQVSDNVFAKLIVEFEHIGANEDAIVNGQGNERTIEVEQAEIDITAPWKTTTAAFGAILVPFGLENYYHAPSDNPLATRSRAFSEGGVFPNTFTDAGIQLTQQVPHVGILDVYTINGDARNGQVPQDSGPGGNNGKSVGAELQVTKLIDGLNVGVSAITGPWSDQGVFNPVTGSSESARSTRYGAHLDFQKPYFRFTGEMIAGTDQHDSAMLGAGGEKLDKKVSGYYAMLVLGPVKNVSLVARLGGFNNDREVKDNGKTEISYGIRYKMYPGLYVKTEYRVTTETPKVEDNMIISQISATF